MSHWYPWFSVDPISMTKAFGVLPLVAGASFVTFTN
jgi:hypothetical protein